MQVRARITRRATRVGVTLSDGLSHSLEAYLELLEKWNRRVSLTSLSLDTATDQAIDRLIIEPLLATRQLPASSRVLIDVGSGGGSPAIPMKLATPRLQLTMVEAKIRKAAFLREAVRQLALAETLVEAARLEHLLARPHIHQVADIVSVRAVRVDLKLLGTLQAFIKPGGLLFLFTSSRASEPPLLPQLAAVEAIPLIPEAGSQLRVLRKTK